jgi:hypothetical protein
MGYCLLKFYDKIGIVASIYGKVQGVEGKVQGTWESAAH